MPKTTEQKRDEAERIYVNAQYAIQGVMLGQKPGDMLPDHASITAPILAESVAMAMAMIIDADPATKTDADIEETARTYADMVAAYAKTLRKQSAASGQTVLHQLFSAITATH